MHARTRLLLTSLSVAALVLACGDDGPEIDEAADRRLVREVALTVDDLPEGFEEVDVDDGDDSADALTECGDLVDIDEDEVDDNRVAQSGDDVAFRLEGAESFTQVGGEAASFRDAGLASQLLEAFDDDDFFDCVASALEDELADDEGVTLGDVDTIDPVADGDAAAALSVELESNGVPFELQVHFVLIDRFGLTVQVLSGPDGVDDDLVEDAFDAMADRLEDARE